MISAKEGKKSTSTPKPSGALEEDSILDMSKAFTTQHSAKKRRPNLMGSQANNKHVLNSCPFRACSACPLWEEERKEQAWLAGSMCLQGSCFVVRIKATQQEPVTTLSTSRKRLLCELLNPLNKMRCLVHLHDVHLMFHSMFNPNHTSQGCFNLHP